MSNTKNDAFYAHIRILFMKDVCALTGYTPQHIYRLMRAGKFPLSIRLGENRIGWRLADIEGWIASRQINRPPQAPESKDHPNEKRAS